MLFVYVIYSMLPRGTHLLTVDTIMGHVLICCMNSCIVFGVDTCTLVVCVLHVPSLCCVWRCVPRGARTRYHSPRCVTRGVPYMVDHTIVVVHVEHRHVARHYLQWLSVWHVTSMYITIAISGPRGGPCMVDDTIVVVHVAHRHVARNDLQCLSMWHIFVWICCLTNWLPRGILFVYVIYSMLPRGIH